MGSKKPVWQVAQGDWQWSLFGLILDQLITTPEHHMTATEHATATDFANWQAQAAGMTNSELLWTVRDCQRAESAMRGWNPIKEGFYSDQASTYGMELTKRRQR